MRHSVPYRLRLIQYALAAPDCLRKRVPVPKKPQCAGNSPSRHPIWRSAAIPESPTPWPLLHSEETRSGVVPVCPPTLNAQKVEDEGLLQEALPGQVNPKESELYQGVTPSSRNSRNTTRQRPPEGVICEAARLIHCTIELRLYGLQVTSSQRTVSSPDGTNELFTEVLCEYRPIARVHPMLTVSGVGLSLFQ